MDVRPHRSPRMSHSHNSGKNGALNYGLYSTVDSRPACDTAGRTCHCGHVTAATSDDEASGGKLSAATLRAVQTSSGDLAALTVSAMEQRLPWFARMPADQRASVLLIAQTGVA